MGSSGKCPIRSANFGYPGGKSVDSCALGASSALNCCGAPVILASCGCFDAPDECGACGRSLMAMVAGPGKSVSSSISTESYEVRYFSLEMSFQKML